ncbi:MAG TPA: bifunctional diguanylate cyclase/phosphodiesterase, partial [Micavibrio sp.]
MSWRITTVVFMTILTVQISIMSVTLKDYENDRIAELVESARSALVPWLESGHMDVYASPLSDKAAENLITTTRISGLAVYSTDLNLIRTFGEPLATVLLTQ